MGGIECISPKETPNLLGLRGESFPVLVKDFGGKHVFDELPDESHVKILFGIDCYDSNCIEAVSSGWRGGIHLYGQERILLKDRNGQNSLGPVASASIACYAAFCKVFRFDNAKIELNTGISLWNLGAGKSWYTDENDGPEELNFPRNIWSLGLGHLGQAYLWTLAFMGVKKPAALTFLLQDYDDIGPENIGSQVLTLDEDVCQVKTRPCVRFLEAIGFKTRLIEKPFEKGDSLSDWMKDFTFLLNGVDNIPTRKNLDKTSLGLFLDGATNGKLSLFDSFTMKNVTRIDKSPDDMWRKADDGQEEILHVNLYKRFKKEHQCGVLTNIGISTPFVGLFSSTIVISEMLRSIDKGKVYLIVSLQLRDLDSIIAIEDGEYGIEYFRNAV